MKLQKQEELLFCNSCEKTLPMKRFPATSSTSRTLVSGETVQYRYRESECRKCKIKKNKALGLCKCGKILESKSACARCLQATRESAIRKRRQDRLEAIRQYGGCCNYCGELLEVFLTIDHINNNGAEHRKMTGKGKNAGHNIGAWLRLNDYPSGFQILCVNCNHAKYRIGEKELLRLLKENGRIK